VLRPHPGPQEAFLATPADIGIYGGAAGCGKLLALDTPLPTPAGWTTMGDVRRGEVLFNESGQQCRVLRVHEIDPAPVSYRMEFDDGSWFLAGADHLWLTFSYSEREKGWRRTPEFRSMTRARRALNGGPGGKKSAKFTAMIVARNKARQYEYLDPPRGSVLTTKEIAATLRTHDGRVNHAIPVAGALELPEADLPLDPYLLGCWLGDGSTTSAAVTTADPPIMRAFARGGFRPSYHRKYTWGFLGLQTVLKRTGVFGRKHIPAPYLRASRDQRLALLQGLMDTDGTASRSTGVSITTIKPELRDGIFELVTSLGWKVHVVERRARLYGRDCGPAWDLAWTPAEVVFRLQRKRRRQRLGTRPVTRFRYVTSCQEVAPVPMRCITVDAPSGLYLAGRAMIPTHNTRALLIEPLRHRHLPGFRAVLFRRTSPEITNAGGLKDNSEELYYRLGADLNLSTLKWTFPSGARVELAHLQHDKDKQGYDGSQIPLLEFDQLESFGESMFWYMQSRNRDPSGQVRPYLRASCNPVPADDPVGGWLRKLIDWWIGADGLPIPERSGVLRWFVRGDDGDLTWAGSREELEARVPGSLPLSLTFIPGKLEDNPTLVNADPLYRAKLMNLPPFERSRLLGGNWNAKAEAGQVFDRSWFRIVPAAPREARRARGWDKAATEADAKKKRDKKGPDYSAGVKLAEADGIYYVEDVVRGQWRAHERNDLMLQCAQLDGPEVEVHVEQEPGSGGKESAELSVQQLAGFIVRAEPVTGDKLARARALAAQAGAKNVRLVEGPWNEAFLTELHNFPDGAHDDQVDAASLAFNKLALGSAGIQVGDLGGLRQPVRRRVTLTG